MSAPKMLPALLGGLFIGVLSSLPYIKGGNICCCLWVVAGGALAAWLMQQNTPRPITVGEGALVGLLSGLVGTFVWIAWGAIGLMIFSSSPFDMADFQRAMGEAEGVTPEAREALESLSPAVILVVGSVIWAVVSMVFATIGGLIGALLFRRKGGPTAGVPAPSGPASPGPTFTPPTFITPPAPSAPFTPPPPAPPAPPPAGFASVDSDATPVTWMAPNAPPAPVPTPVTPPPPSWPEPPEDVGDAATIMIPARSLGLPPTPKPPAPPAPPSGAVPPAREPDSH
jgi:hypothetical protein